MSWDLLRALLVDRYEELKRRLARRLGSSDLATEALQETWLRLQRPGEPGVLNRPDAYLFRVALNVAADRRDAERRRLALSEVEMLRHLDDDELDPERFAESRSEVVALAQALDELSPRCRAIFIAARLDEMHAKPERQLQGWDAHREITVAAQPFVTAGAHAATKTSYDQ
jgi:RNA polymerase sigma factor (sigma-70 family)